MEVDFYVFFYVDLEFAVHILIFSTFFPRTLLCDKCQICLGDPLCAKYMENGVVSFYFFGAVIVDRFQKTKYEVKGLVEGYLLPFLDCTRISDFPGKNFLKIGKFFFAMFNESA